MKDHPDKKQGSEKSGLFSQSYCIYNEAWRYQCDKNKIFGMSVFNETEVSQVDQMAIKVQRKILKFQ